MKRGLPTPPEIGDKVWIVIPEHYYPRQVYPEFADKQLRYAPAPALADVKKLSFFDSGSKLTPTVECVSHLIGNQNNVHHVMWPRDIGRTFFWTREECIKRCEELADKYDQDSLNVRLGYNKCLRPWREHEEIC